MDDLTAIFGSALEHKKEWSEEVALSALQRIQSAIPKSYLDWENGDENWGRIILNNDPIVYLNSVVPVCFIKSDHAAVLSSILKSILNSVIEYDSFSEHRFRIDRDMVQEISSRAPSDQIDFDNISLEEIWFCTV